MRPDPAAVETERFADAARDYCRWAEAAPSAAETDMLIARRHLASLTALALDLPDAACDANDPVPIPTEAWRSVFKRFGELPVNYYNNCIDPLHAVGAEPSLGDLADDLADIWRDLKGGLLLFDAGQAGAAACAWREGFAIHWGRHAASALFVLQCWLQVQETGSHNRRQTIQRSLPSKTEMESLTPASSMREKLELNNSSS
jgi:hypothetical protein